MKDLQKITRKLELNQKELIENTKKLNDDILPTYRKAQDEAVIIMENDKTVYINDCQTIPEFLTDANWNLVNIKHKIRMNEFNIRRCKKLLGI